MDFFNLMNTFFRNGGRGKREGEKGEGGESIRYKH